jgi:hypothetical protein
MTKFCLISEYNFSIEHFINGRYHIWNVLDFASSEKANVTFCLSQRLPEGFFKIGNRYEYFHPPAFQFIFHYCPTVN